MIGYEQMTKETPQNELVSLEASGQAVLRSGWDQKADYLHFMCGSLGGGHGHFDKLHMDLCVAGEDVLIDSGRYTYVDGSLRSSSNPPAPTMCRWWTGRNTPSARVPGR